MHAQTENLTASLSSSVIKDLGASLIIITVIVVFANFFYASTQPDIEDQEEVESTRVVSPMAIFLGAVVTISIGLVMFFQGGNGNKNGESPVGRARIIYKKGLKTYVQQYSDGSNDLEYKKSELDIIIEQYRDNDNVFLIDCCFDDQEKMFELFLGPDNGNAKTLEQCKSSKCSSKQINASVQLFTFRSHTEDLESSITECVNENPTFPNPIEYTVIFGSKTRKILCPDYESSENCEEKAFGVPYAIHGWLKKEASEVAELPWFVPIGSDGKTFNLVPFKGLTVSSLNKDESEASVKYILDRFEKFDHCGKKLD